MSFWFNAGWFQRPDSKLGHNIGWRSLRLNAWTLQVGNQYFWIPTMACGNVSLWPLAEFLHWERLRQSPAKTEVFHLDQVQTACLLLLLWFQGHLLGKCLTCPEAQDVLCWELSDCIQKRILSWVYLFSPVSNVKGDFALHWLFIEPRKFTEADRGLPWPLMTAKSVQI